MNMAMHHATQGFTSLTCSKIIKQHLRSTKPFHPSPQQKVLEERMLHHLDNPVTLCGGGNMTRLAGRVFAALPLPGIGGGNVAQARAEARGRQLALLLALAHSLMDTLLDGVVEKEVREWRSHPYPREHSGLTLRPLEDITTDPISSRLAIIARLSNTLTFVAEMITDAANTAITFTADHLLIQQRWTKQVMGLGNMSCDQRLKTLHLEDLSWKVWCCSYWYFYHGLSERDVEGSGI
ncbi:hypothetical protein E2C01_054155 [Portunus trituberculatus]|uniref:Uncharacterized protein n=1 Tax=Portunus trituberculatus TaxID=210409 RepID=A0A5B7GSY8_PORTR|nr:hypothetical protein [Portunus trituberculatus]